MHTTVRPLIETLSSDGIISQHILAIAASIANKATRTDGTSWFKLGIIGFDDVFQELVEAILLAQESGGYDPSKGQEVDYYRAVMINRLIILSKKQGKTRLTEVMLTEIFAGAEELSVVNTVDSDTLEGYHERDIIDPEDVIEGVQSLINAYEFSLTLEQGERDVLAYLMRGYTQEEAARHLGISQTKVSRRKKDIAMKMVVYANVLGYDHWIIRWRESMEDIQDESCRDDQESRTVKLAVSAATSGGTKTKHYRALLATGLPSWA